MGFFETLKLIVKLWNIIQSVFSYYKQKNKEKWEDAIEQDLLNYQDLVNAKTLEQRRQAERKIADGWFKK